MSDYLVMLLPAAASLLRSNGAKEDDGESSAAASRHGAHPRLVRDDVALFIEGRLHHRGGRARNVSVGDVDLIGAVIVLLSTGRLEP